MNTLILGVGNLLLSDEAVGVRLVEELGREYRFAPGIELLDGGTAGMELLEAMASRDHIISGTRREGFGVLATSRYFFQKSK